jgi:hypothetical protein
MEICELSKIHWRCVKCQWGNMLMGMVCLPCSFLLPSFHILHPQATENEDEEEAKVVRGIGAIRLCVARWADWTVG